MAGRKRLPDPEMPAMSPETPQASKRHRTRSSASSSVLIQGTDGIDRISKPSSQAKARYRPDTPKPKGGCEAAETPAKVEPNMDSTMGDSTMSSPSCFSDDETMEDTSDAVPGVSTASEDQVKEMMVLDAAEEPIGQEEPQDLNEVDRKLTEFTARSTKTKLDQNQLKMQFFRRICILYDGDPGNKKVAIRRAMLDTGSWHSLTFESHMKNLEIHFQRFKEPKFLYSVEQRPFRVIGRREILFRYRGKEDVHRARLCVLEDPPKNEKPSFDILLGREHLIRADVVQINRDVAGDAFLVLDRRLHARVKNPSK